MCIRDRDIDPADNEHIIGPPADLGHPQVGPSAGARLTGQRGDIAVSYTHLDVYKRQVPWPLH